MEARTRGNKHLLCKDADTELALLSHRISKISKTTQLGGVEFMHYAPALRSDKDERKQIQERFDDMILTVSRVKCYIGLFPDDKQQGIPDEEFTGRDWLRGFCKEFWHVQHEFQSLQVDVIYEAILLIHFVCLDIAQNLVFSILYKPMFATATEILLDCLTPCAEANGEYLLTLLQIKERGYKALPVMKRLIGDAASLGSKALVMRISEVFRRNVQKWDRTHGLRLPRVRRVLEVFAFELEAAHESGIMDLAALFNKL